MEINYNDNKENDNKDLTVVVNQDSEVKSWLVDYVGQKNNPEDDNVTLEMIVDTMAEEFPEFLFAVAEENFIRGYNQALTDSDAVSDLTGCGNEDNMPSVDPYEIDISEE
tara:strand:+ start:1408 stop:1737 length:330 start_codon:yes stop_codon:yes gene_type:complete